MDMPNDKPVNEVAVTVISKNLDSKCRQHIRVYNNGWTTKNRFK